MNNKLQEYIKIRAELLEEGIDKGYIREFPDAVFDYLRPYSYGGVPASILLFIPELCNGLCYDRSMLMQLAFDNCKVVHADIEGLRVQGVCPEHSYVETTDIEGGPWILDTSDGLMYKKFWYEKMEKPKINMIISKEACMNNYEVQRILASNFDNDKYALFLIMPQIELILENVDENGYITFLYKDMLNEEIAKLKEAIGYDAMVAEERANMELMFTDPAALDKKLKIVRDEYGIEVSRNGVPNPYYRKPEPQNSISLENSLEYVKNFVNNLDYNSLQPSEQMLNEYYEIVSRARLRRKKIEQNPTQNVYDEKQ